MAFPYHRLHHYAAVVLRAVGVQHIGVGLIVLLHVFVVRRVEVCAVERNVIGKLVRQSERNVHQPFFQVVVGRRQRARDGHRIEVAIAENTLSAVYLAVVLLEENVDIELCAAVGNVRKGRRRNEVLPSLQVAIRVGVFITQV